MGRLKKFKLSTVLKVLVTFICILGLMGMMFYFSSQSGYESHRLSKSIARYVRDLSPLLTEFKQSDLGKDIAFEQLLRKGAHFVEYFILAALVCVLLLHLKIREGRARMAAVIVCTAYSFFDELHQGFIQGRTSLLTDIFIDISGSIAAVLFIRYFIRKKKTSTRQDSIKQAVNAGKG